MTDDLPTESELEAARLAFDKLDQSTAVGLRGRGARECFCHGYFAGLRAREIAAANELIALTEELGLYGTRRRRPIEGNEDDGT